MRWLVAVIVSTVVAWWMPGTAGDALSDWVVAQAVVDGLDPYAPTTDLADAQGFWLGGVEGPHPRLPGAILLLLPYTLIPLLWVTFVARLTVCLSMVAVWWVCRPPWWAAPIVAVPVLSAVWWGNMSALVTLLVGVGIVRRSGTAVGVATVLRAWPWFIGLALFVVGRRRAAAVSGLVFTGLNGVGLLLPGVSAEGTVHAFRAALQYPDQIFNLAIPVPFAVAFAVLFLVALRSRPVLFRWSVLPGLWLSPAVWFYYLTVLAVPFHRATGEQGRPPASEETRGHTASHRGSV